jgi:hypothetical protein
MIQVLSIFSTSNMLSVLWFLFAIQRFWELSRSSSDPLMVSLANYQTRWCAIYRWSYEIISPGAFDQKSLAILKKRGYIVANWSFDSEDAVGATPEQSMASYKELSKQFPASQITLNHETYQTTAEKVTPYAVPLLQKAGYKLVHVSECLGTGTKLTDLYQWVGKPSARDVSSSSAPRSSWKHHELTCGLEFRHRGRAMGPQLQRTTNPAIIECDYNRSTHTSVSHFLTL